MPGSVCEAGVAASDGTVPSGWVSLAKPKSRIFTRPSRVTKIFSGFRSRWTIPFSCAAARPRRNLLGVFDGFAHRQRPGTQPLAQCLTLQKLGDHIGRAFVLAKIVHRQNVRMIQRSRGLRLLLKAPQPLGIAGETHRQDLDRDLAVEPRVPRTIYLAHAASAGRRHDLVRPKF